MHRLDPVPTSLSWCRYRFHQSPPQTEAPRLVSASSTPIPPGHWEWSAFYKETLPQKPSLAEVNQSYFFTPEWKYIASISFIFQRKYVTFDTAIKSKFSNLLALGCNPVPPWLTLALSTLQTPTDPQGELQAPHHSWCWGKVIRKLPENLINPVIIAQGHTLSGMTHGTGLRNKV